MVKLETEDVLYPKLLALRSMSCLFVNSSGSGTEYGLFGRQMHLATWNAFSNAPCDAIISIADFMARLTPKAIM